MSFPTHQPLSCAALREIDRRATDTLGIPGLLLMENAARGATELALEFLAHRPGTVFILCGPGNNGGDGFAMARWFTVLGKQVELVCFTETEQARGDAAVMREIATRMGLGEYVIREDRDLDALAPEFAKAALIVDALLGTGFDGEPRGLLLAGIHAINAAHSPRGPCVLAVDVPSGLHADSGSPAAATVRADRTATFVAAKLGFATAETSSFTGRVTVVGIGVPPELIERVRAELG